MLPPLICTRKRYNFLLRICTILINRLENKACPVKVQLDKLTALDITLLGWVGRKTSTQADKQTYSFLKILCSVCRTHFCNPVLIEKGLLRIFAYYDDFMLHNIWKIVCLCLSIVLMFFANKSREKHDDRNQGSIMDTLEYATQSSMVGITHVWWDRLKGIGINQVAIIYACNKHGYLITCFFFQTMAFMHVFCALSAEQAYWFPVAGTGSYPFIMAALFNWMHSDYSTADTISNKHQNTAKGLHVFICVGSSSFSIIACGVFLTCFVFKKGIFVWKWPAKAYGSGIVYICKGRVTAYTEIILSLCYMTLRSIPVGSEVLALLEKFFSGSRQK